MGAPTSNTLGVPARQKFSHLLRRPPLEVGGCAAPGRRPRVARGAASRLLLIFFFVALGISCAPPAPCLVGAPCCLRRPSYGRPFQSCNRLRLCPRLGQLPEGACLRGTSFVFLVPSADPPLVVRGWPPLVILWGASSVRCGWWVVAWWRAGASGSYIFAGAFGSSG